MWVFIQIPRIGAYVCVCMCVYETKGPSKTERENSFDFSLSPLFFFSFELLDSQPLLEQKTDLVYCNHSISQTLKVHRS